MFRSLVSPRPRATGIDDSNVAQRSEHSEETTGQRSGHLSNQTNDHREPIGHHSETERRKSKRFFAFRSREILQGVVERDEAIKKARDDVLSRQKDLEQQLNDEQLLYQELQEKYDKACEKREAMKDDLHQAQQQLEKTKADYK